MQLSLTLITSILSVVGYVAAHGFVERITIGSTTYQGAQDGASSSPFRKVTTGDPNLDPTSNNIVCGIGAVSSATQTASANPGDLVQIWWENEGGSHGTWEHNTGPIQSFLANCGGDCSSFVPSSSTEWFKISELGKTSTTANEWVQGNLNSGAPVNITIPSDLASGNYIFRHEIIALQNAMTQGLAEFYTQCFQLSVGGSQTGKPDSTVHFPGAYTPTDAGILINVYNAPSAPYDFPGGPVSNIKDPLSDTNDAVSNPIPIAGGSSPASSAAVGASSSPAAPINVAPTPPIAEAPSSVASAPITSPTSNSSSSSSGSGSNKQCSLKASKKKRAALVPAEDLASIKERGMSVHRKRRLTSY